MVIKLVCETDKKYIEEILELEQEVFGLNGAIDLWNLKPYIKYGKVFVLLHEEKVIATCELLKSWDNKKVYLYGFAVKKQFSGKGVGSKFLENVINSLDNENIEAIELTVAPENLAGIKLYEKFGFERVKVLENEYGEGQDRYLYIKLFDKAIQNR